MASRGAARHDLTYFLLGPALASLAIASLFLASDDARFVTGQVLFVDGRMSNRIG